MKKFSKVSFRKSDRLHSSILKLWRTGATISNQSSGKSGQNLSGTGFEN